MEHDAWFFVGVFAFIFLIWIATGGPTHPLAFTGPRLAQPGVLGGGTYLSLPRAPFTIGGSNVSLSDSSSGGGTVPNQALPTIIGGVFGPPSEYRGLVTMSRSVSSAGSSNPANEMIELQASYNSRVPINISGWRIMSEATGASSIIPKGTEVPTSGVVNAIQDIVLAPGKRAIIVSGQSPIGASFRENKCIGYFSTFQKFSPSLPQNCPVPADELPALYGNNYIRDVACIEYVNRLSRCQVTLSPPVGLSGSCQAFLVKYLNYNGCVETHKNDVDFMGDTWRIYLGRSTSMWRTKHEIVKLVDTLGNTVDAFSY